MLIEVPVRLVRLSVRTSDSDESHEIDVYLDLFFSRWASRLEHFIPMIIPKPKLGKGDSKLSPLEEPANLIDRMISSYRSYAERVSELRDALIKARRSYRFNFIFPVNTSLLEAEDLVAKELGIKEGAIRGLNLLLGVGEWDFIEEVRVLRQGELSYTLDEFRVKGGRVKYYRGHMGNSKIMEWLIEENEGLKRALYSL